MISGKTTETELNSAIPQMVYIANQAKYCLVFLYLIQFKRNVNKLSSAATPVRICGCQLKAGGSGAAGSIVDCSIGGQC